MFCFVIFDVLKWGFGFVLGVWGFRGREKELILFSICFEFGFGLVLFIFDF